MTNKEIRKQKWYKLYKEINHGKTIINNSLNTTDDILMFFYNPK